MDAGSEVFRRFLRPDARPDEDVGAIDLPASAIGQTATVRRIVARLEALDPEDGRFLAGFAYVMSRAAHADHDITDEETSLMEGFVIEFGRLDPGKAGLVVEMAKIQASMHGQTEDYLVTREFGRHATLEQKLSLLRCCFAVAAANGTITADEASVINQIARELDVPRDRLNAVREEFVERLSAIQAMRRMQGR
jgi:uncharacterized tellurite resistance protein B-like protein